MKLNIAQKLCLAFFIILALFWITLFTSGTTEGLYNYLYVFLYGLIPLFGGAVAMFSVRSWGGLSNALGKAVFFIGLGLFCWGIGETIWSYYPFFKDIEIPYPSIADIFFAPSVFFYTLGAIYLARTTGAGLGLKNAFGKIFAIFAPALVLGLTYYIFIILGGVSLISNDGDTMKTILDIAYPLGDFVALTVSIVISGLSFKYLSGGHKYDIYSILAGLAVMFVADSILSYTTNIETAYNGDFGDLAFTIAVFLLTFGILGFIRPKNVPTATA